MAYNEITNRNSPNYWRGRTAKISGITIHHWGDPKSNPTAEGVVNWLCNAASQVSAHFVVTGTGRRVWQLVNDADTAWHAMSGNASTIGLELDPRCRNEDYDVAAELIADLWRHYGKLPLYRHSKFVATACPGAYDLTKLKKLAEAKLNPAPVVKPVVTPTTKAVPAAKKLTKPLTFTTTKSPTSVWDLTTNPNYKAVTTISKGKQFVAYATIDFNNSTYYITEYSYTKKLKNGINSVDLKAYVAPVKPAEPLPTPEVTPAPVIVPDQPVDETVQEVEVTAPPIVEQPNYSEQNNVLLNKLVGLVQELLNRWISIFK